MKILKVIESNDLPSKKDDPNKNIKITALCEDLNKYLMHQFNYKTPPARCNPYTISATRVKFQMHLRYRNFKFHDKANTLVIAALAFQKTQKGHGTDLLLFFIKIADKYNIKNIGLESTNDLSNILAERLGFNQIDSRNHVITIEQLKLNLNHKQVA